MCVMIQFTTTIAATDFIQEHESDLQTLIDKIYSKLRGRGPPRDENVGVKKWKFS